MVTAYRTLAERPAYDEAVERPQPVSVAAPQLEDDDDNIATVRVVGDEEEETISFGLRFVLVAVMLLSMLTALAILTR